MSNKRVALITGANKGIGFAIARQLGERDHAVIVGCRDLERGEQAAIELRGAGIEARSLLLDVTLDDSVTEAMKDVELREGRLDVLVNNAGMHFGPPPAASEESIDQIRQIFEINVFGALRVTQTFLPLLRESDAARIVMMSSGLGSLDMTLDMRSENWGVGFAGYCASKTALNMLTIKLAKELDREGIKVNAADPGLTSTDLTGNGPGHSAAMGARTPVALGTLGPVGPTAGFFACAPSGDLVRQPW